MNKRALCLIFLIVAQLAWLGTMYVSRSVELEQSPVMRLRLDMSDPRNPFRGYYQRVTFQELIPVESPKMGKSLYIAPETAKLFRDLPRTEPLTDDARPLSRWGEDTPIAVFYRPGSDGCWEVSRIEARGSKAAVPAPGEVCVASRADLLCYYRKEGDREVHPNGGHFYMSTDGSEPPRAVYVRVEKSLCHYLPEDKCDLMTIWRNHYGYDKTMPPFEVTVDLIVRPDGSVVTKQLYCNGVPWTEAIDRIRAGTFLCP